jgi:phosphatidylinositol alpha-1,6-mannosyltransferase
VSPEGVDEGRFANLDPADGDVVRRKYGLEGTLVLLTVGRLVTRKGHDLVLRALPAVLSDLPGVRYLIVGTGPQESALRSLAAKQGVERAVTFAGYVEDSELCAHYLAADVIVMPCREVDGDVEGFGIAFMEAAACRRPTVGGRSGGAPEAIADGETGRLVDPEDPEELAGVLTSLLGDPDLRKSMGEAGRRRVLAEFRYETISEGILGAITAADRATTPMPSTTDEA